MKYLNLMFQFIKMGFIADLEYRLNFFIRIVTDIFWYAAQILVFEVLFLQTKRLGGWSIEETRVFLGFLFIVDALWMAFLSENLEHFSNKVRTGELDLLLTKPIESQFLVSLQRFNSAYLGNLLMGIAWLIFSVRNLGYEISSLQWFWLVITLPASLVLTYSLRFFFSISALFFVRAENLGYVWYQFYRLGTRPDGIYPPWVRLILMTIMPVAFIASVPSQIILGRLPWPWCFAMVAAAGFFLYLSHRLWNRALKSYGSASS